jgi:glycosyltransferase involved in cell wall biosynthesis
LSDLSIQMVLNRYLPVIGGAEHQAQHLCISLQKKGQTVRLVTRLLEPDWPRQTRINEVPVTRLAPVGLSKRANILIIISMIRYLVSHRQVFDIIHVHTLGPVAIAAIIAAKLTGKPVILKAPTHGDITRQNYSGEALTLYTRLLRRFLLPDFAYSALLRQADAIIAISHEILEEGKQAGLQKTMIQIPNGVDTRMFHPVTISGKHKLRHQLNLEADKFYFFYAGRLVWRKRLDIVLKALPDVLRHHPDCHLLIAGSGTMQSDSTEQELREMITHLQLNDAVSFLGMVENVPEYLQAADAFVFPSVREGLPNVILEAMASGMPIVASRISGVTDCLHDKSAWLFSPADWQQCRDAMLEMLANDQARATRSEIALHDARHSFSLDTVAERYISLYQRLIDGRN